MKILAIDSALNGCGVCIYDSDTGLFHDIYRSEPHGQAEHLLPMIDKVLGEHAIGFSEIDIFAITEGPGGFTGLRVGYSVAKTLSDVLSKPLIGVSTFKALLSSFIDAGQVFNEFKGYTIVIDTKRDDYYYSLYSHDGSVLVEGACIKSENLKEFLSNDSEQIVLTDCPEKLISWRLENKMYGLDKVSCKALAIEAYNCYVLSSFGCSDGPVYLREADVSMPKAELRKILNF